MDDESLLAVAAFVGVLAVPPGALAQSDVSGASTQPTFQADATNVIVDVVVTGPHNSPAEGLSKDSFTVLENGHEQQIVSFDAYPSANAATPQPALALPPGVYTNQQVVPGNDSVDVLLIDALNTPAVKQADTHRTLITYLKTLPVTKPVAIFTLDTSLHQLEDFSTDHTALLKAVEDFTRSPRKSPLSKTQADTEQQ